MCRESQAKTRVVFQAKTQAEFFTIELPPRMDLEVLNIPFLSTMLDPGSGDFKNVKRIVERTVRVSDQSHILMIKFV